MSSIRGALEQIANGSWESFHIDGADGHRVRVEGSDRFVPERTVKAILTIARDALSAFDAGGFVVVPQDPTPEMIAHAREAHVARVRRKVAEGTIGRDPDGTLAEQYRAMIRGHIAPPSRTAGRAQSGEST